MVVPAPTRRCHAPQPDRASRESAREAQETDRLFRRWRASGDLWARDEIFQRYLPLARRLARRYWTSSESFEDVAQVAGLGLVAAMNRFDPARDTAFPAFAVPTILGELKRYFRGTAWCSHVPRPAQELALRVQVATRELESASGRTPRVDELAQYLETSTDDVVTGLCAASARRSVSLAAPLGGRSEEELTIGDSIGAEDERYALVDMCVVVSGGTRHLLPAQKRALGLRVGQDLTQAEIADRLNCSQMQVSRLLRDAAAKLREVTGLDLAA